MNDRRALELSYDDIDPELRKRQDEWVDLLYKVDINIDMPPSFELSDSEKEYLAAMWFKHGTFGLKIDYPQNRYELNAYIISGSQSWLFLFTVIYFIHTCIPFFMEPSCPWVILQRDEHININSTGGGKYVSPLGVRCVDLVAIGFYLLDAYLRIVVNSQHRWNSPGGGWYKDKWVLFRLIACLIIFVDTMYFFATHKPIRYSRSLIPLIYLSRRNSLQNIIEGMCISFSKSWKVLGLFLGVYMLWSYVGYVTFQSVQVENGSLYNSFPDALLTTLNCITSRSYSLFTLAPYFDVNATTALYFVSLVYVGDLICMNLIIAIGNRQFRLFAGRVFARQLRHRRQAIISIHEMLSDDEGFISKKTWIGFCRHITGKNKVSRVMAEALFELERRKDMPIQCIDIIGLFKLCALLSDRIDIDVSRIPTVFIEDKLYDTFDLKDPVPSFINEIEMSGASGLTDPTYIERSTEFQKRNGDDISAYDRDANSDTDNTSSQKENHDSTLFPEIERSNTDSSVQQSRLDLCDGMNSPSHSHYHSLESGEPTADLPVSHTCSSNDIGEYIIAPHTSSAEEDDFPFSMSPVKVSQQPSALSVYSDNEYDFGYPVPINPRAADTYTEASSNELNAASSRKPSYFFDWLWVFSTTQRDVLTFITYRYRLDSLFSPHSALGKFVHTYIPTVNIFGPFFIVVRVLLAVQIVIIASPSVGQLMYTIWTVIGWVILFLLWVEMGLLIIAYGFMPYLRRTGFGYVLLINVISLALMVEVAYRGNTAHNRYTGVFYALIVAQCCRFLRFISLLPGSSVFVYIFPLVLRMTFVIFAVIYFFAVFAHTRFCNIYDENIIPENEDSTGWLQYENVMNFSSLLQSIFTLFEVAMLGNWTPFMSAASEKRPIESMVFFFSYRLTMTLVVIPLLVAFIIQAFIAKRDEEENSQRALNELRKGKRASQDSQKNTSSSKPRFKYMVMLNNDRSGVNPPALSPTCNESDKTPLKVVIPRRGSIESITSENAPGKASPMVAEEESAFPVTAGKKTTNMMSVWAIGETPAAPSAKLASLQLKLEHAIRELDQEKVKSAELALQCEQLTEKYKHVGI